MISISTFLLMIRPYEQNSDKLEFVFAIFEVVSYNAFDHFSILSVIYKEENP